MGGLPLLKEETRDCVFRMRVRSPHNALHHSEVIHDQLIITEALPRMGDAIGLSHDAHAQLPCYREEYMGAKPRPSAILRLLGK